MFSLSAVAQAILYLVVAAIIFGLLWWVTDDIKEPFRWVAKIILKIAAVFVIIGILLSLAGGPALFRP